MALFMAPVYGVDAGHLAFEFTKTRGVIHFHEMLCLIHNMMEPISEAMKVTFVGVSEAVKHLDEYIDAHWTVPPQDKDETDPLRYKNPTSFRDAYGMKYREHFCNKSTGGKEALATYAEDVKRADDKL